MTKTIILDNETVEVDGVVYKREMEEWPKEGDDYWFIDDENDLNKITWYENKYHYYRRNMNNCFRTEEAAQKEKTRLQAVARVNQEIREKSYRLEDVDWRDIDQCKYYMFSHEGKVNFSDSSINSGELFGCLKDKESCEALIASHSDDIRLALSV